eukprot:12903065-Prorocentrum_lima.AAC.1
MDDESVLATQPFLEQQLDPNMPVRAQALLGQMKASTLQVAREGKERVEEKEEIRQRMTSMEEKLGEFKQSTD